MNTHALVYPVQLLDAVEGHYSVLPLHPHTSSTPRSARTRVGHLCVSGPRARSEARSEASSSLEGRPAERSLLPKAIDVYGRGVSSPAPSPPPSPPPSPHIAAPIDAPIAAPIDAPHEPPGVSSRVWQVKAGKDPMSTTAVPAGCPKGSCPKASARSGAVEGSHPPLLDRVGSRVGSLREGRLLRISPLRTEASRAVRLPPLRRSQARLPARLPRALPSAV